jgi:glycosyltransferase involved in cell wall biosynthesis
VKKTMKILLVMDETENPGGAEIYVSRLKEYLEGRGHEVEFFVGGRTATTKLWKFLSGWYSLKYAREIGETVESFMPDVIFSLNFFYTTPSFLPAARKAGVPVVHKVPDMVKYTYSLHGLNSFIVPKQFLHRQLIKKYVTAFVAASETTRRWIEQDLGCLNTKLIRNPVLYPVREKAPVINKGTRRLIYTGRLTEDKGLETLLESISILNRKVDGLRLDIYGDGRQKARLRSLVRFRNLESVVSLNGCVPHASLMEEYAMSDVFVLPSTIPENSPLTIQEAMSQGTPAITTNMGGQAELVKDGVTGFLAEPGNPVDLAEKLEAVLTDEKLQRELSENCLAYAKTFSLERHVAEIEELFESVIHENQGEVA